jgi:hypothetical protein
MEQAENLYGVRLEPVTLEVVEFVGGRKERSNAEGTGAGETETAA